MECLTMIISFTCFTYASNSKHKTKFIQMHSMIEWGSLTYTRSVGRSVGRSFVRNAFNVYLNNSNMRIWRIVHSQMQEQNRLTSKYRAPSTRATHQEDVEFGVNAANQMVWNREKRVDEPGQWPKYARISCCSHFKELLSFTRFFSFIFFISFKSFFWHYAS